MVDQINLPDKIVTRLMREVLPEDVQISQEAKNAICKGASIFVLQLTIAAGEQARMNNRKSLQDKDMIASASNLGLTDYAQQLVRFSARKYPKQSTPSPLGISATTQTNDRKIFIL